MLYRSPGGSGVCVITAAAVAVAAVAAVDVVSVGTVSKLSFWSCWLTSLFCMIHRHRNNNSLIQTLWSLLNRASSILCDGPSYNSMNIAIILVKWSSDRVCSVCQ